MPFNLLLLPLLGGFIFVRNWKRSRYYALRSQGEVLLFYSATAGTIFLIISTFLVFLLGPMLPKIDSLWHQMAPYEHSGKAALAFILASTIWIPWNQFFDDEEEIDRVIQSRRDALELIFRTSMGENQLVALTVKNGKVYVGYIVSNVNPAFPMESLGLIPMMSGYRDPTNKRFVFTTQYTDVYDRIFEEVTERVKAEAAEVKVTGRELEDWIEDEIDKETVHFKLAIPIGEIESASIFRMDIYKKYFGVDPTTTELPPQSFE